MVETAFEQFDHMIIIETNEDVTPLFACANEALVAQSAQLMRNGRLGQPQALHQFADTNLPIEQSADDENTGRVAQRIEQVGEIRGDFRGDLILCDD